MDTVRALLLFLVGIFWQGCITATPGVCSVGLTRDQRLYMREQLSCFGSQEAISVSDVEALSDGFFKDMLYGFIGKDQAISVDAVHNMLKRKK